MSDYDLLCQTCNHYPPQQPGSWMCDTCRDRFHANLHAILGSDETPGLRHELDLELTGQARKSTGGGRVTSPTPAMPVNLAASDCLARIRWALLAGYTLTAAALPPVPNTVPDLGEWLLAHEDRFALVSGCGPIADRLDALVRQARRIIDVPPEKTYLGICEACDAPMRAVRTEGNYRCACGLDYDIDDLRDQVADRLYDPDNRMTLTEISQLTGLTLAALGMRIKRGDIAPVVGKGKGAWYRLGDIVTVPLAHEAEAC